MPEKKIDNEPTKKFIKFPTLKSMINDAVRRPTPIKGRVLKIIKSKNAGTLTRDILTLKINFAANT
tara:strand:+ start:431 stop:628 length:198 start_codon:yes stop_codon:yes gene_type:complete